MVLGFIIVRHVNNRQTDYYWKENYTCIRKFYDNPIMIIDDNSNPDFLIENIQLVNCTVIYDKKYKGVAEFLPYYYFHTLKPFDEAVILQDGIFIQKRIDFELGEYPMRFLWTFSNRWNHDIVHLIEDVCSDLLESNELMNIYHQSDKWTGCMGSMSVIKWDFLDKINKRHDLFNRIIPKITSRDRRSALERVIGLLAFYNSDNIPSTMFGDIHAYIKWGTRYSEYVSTEFPNHPIVKVWSGR
jgi:hypothetical protein